MIQPDAAVAGPPATEPDAAAFVPAHDVVSASHRRAKPQPWWRAHPLYLITFLGFILRFTLLTRPVLWGDEGLTYSRACASFRDMLDILQRDGFAPLHYEMYWCIGRFFYLTPLVMRIVPALAGSLMVPAMYFLARQLVGRRTAALTALFTACSAYMLNYARDAKMYPHFWVFCALSPACYLWWLSCRDKPARVARVAWLAWIASSLAMVGLHTPGLILLGLTPLFLLTQRRPHWKQAVLTLVGLAIIVAGPAQYYAKFNNLQDRADERNIEEASGVAWVKDYDAGRTGPDHVLFATTAYLLNWEWPRDEELPQIPRDELAYLEAMAVVLLSLAALGALPWPRNWRGEPLVGGGGAPIARPWWRRLLWIGAWLVVPSYVFYCASVEGFTRPADWVGEVRSWFGNWWWPLGVELVSTMALCLLWDRGGKFAVRPRWFPWFVASAAAALDAGVLAVVCRYARPIPVVVWYDAFADPRLLAAVLIVSPKFAAYAAGRKPWRRVLAIGQFLFVVAAVVGLCEAASAFFPDQPEGSVWMPRYLAVIWPAFAVGLCALLMRLPGRALRWAAIGLLLACNLYKAGERVLDDTEPPVDRMAWDVVHSDTPRRDIIGTRMIVWRPHEVDGVDTREIRTYAAHVNDGIGHPGHGNIFSSAGRYYLTIVGYRAITPEQFREMARTRPEQYFFDIPGEMDPNAIARDVKGAPQLKRVIVWDTEPPTPARSVATDPLQSALGRDWERTGDEHFRIRQHWMWADLGWYRRREYVQRRPLPNGKNEMNAKR